MSGRYNERWSNRSEEARLRCRRTEVRGNHVRQCVEDRRTKHVCQWGGKPFAVQVHDQEGIR